MKRAIAAFSLSILIWSAGHSNGQAPSQGKPVQAVSGERYFGLDEPREWTYEVTFDSPRIFYSPFDLKSGLVASSVTHGFRRLKERQMTLTVRALPGLGKPQEVPVVLDVAAKTFWFAASVCESKLAVVRSTQVPESHPWKSLSPFAKELLSLELRLTPCSKDDKPMNWVLGEMIAFVPADGRSTVSQNGWVSAPSAEPVTVPAGTYSRVMQSKFPRGDGQYAPAHIVESWVAEGVGLIKYRVTERDGLVYEMRLTAIHKVERE